ncbi:xylose isomerase, partial [Xanthomonas hortorum pv. gardneri]
QDLFLAHIGGMDAFARGLEVANALLTSSPLEQWRAERYASFDSGAGAAFADGTSTLVDVAKHAAGNEPKQLSGRQEAYENLINQYLTR